MLIADAQVHVWGPNTPERSWLPGQKIHRDTPFGPEELLREMNAAGVHRCAIVPPRWEGPRHDVVQEAARRFPDRFIAMGRVDTETPGERGVVVDWCRQSGMAGFSCTFNQPNQIKALIEERMDWFWEEAEEAGLPIMVLVPHSLISHIERVAQLHPQLKLTMRHLGLSNGEYDEVAFRDLDKLLALAKYPNLSVNATALPACTKDIYPYRSLHPYLRRVYDAFGPKRMHWGSDLSRMTCTYRQTVTMFTEEIPWLTAEDKEWIMGRSICEWLGWSLPEGEV